MNPNPDDSEQPEPTKLREAWLRGGGTDTELAKRHRRGLTDYDRERLAEAGIDVTDCEIFLEQSKGILGQDFSELCGEAAMNAREREQEGGRRSRSKPPKNPTGMFIRLVLYRVEASANKISGKKPLLPPVAAGAPITPLPLLQETPHAPIPAPQSATEESPRNMGRAKTAISLRKDKTAAEIQQRPAQDRDAMIISSLTLAQASVLPHSDQGTEDTWVRKNGNMTLIIQATKTSDGAGGQTSLGLPYGTIPRLILHYIADQVQRNKSPKVYFGTHLYSFLKKIGISDNADNYRMVTNQILRLTNTTYKLVTRINSASSGVTGIVGKNAPPIAKDFAIYWASKPSRSDDGQGELYETYITLSDDYFKDLLSQKLPIDLTAIRYLRRSSFQLDLYAWLTYRVFTLSKSESRQSRPIPYAVLHEQFGNTFACVRDFKKALSRYLLVIKKIWRGELNYVLCKTGLTLLPSSIQIEAKDDPKKLGAGESQPSASR